MKICNQWPQKPLSKNFLSKFTFLMCFCFSSVMCSFFSSNPWHKPSADFKVKYNQFWALGSFYRAKINCQSLTIATILARQKMPKTAISRDINPLFLKNLTWWRSLDLNPDSYSANAFWYIYSHLICKTYAGLCNRPKNACYRNKKVPVIN